MHIGHCFGDWKSHSGLRGLRLLRVLIGFTLAYLRGLLPGEQPLVAQW